jgi:hypothetical protein
MELVKTKLSILWTTATALADTFKLVVFNFVFRNMNESGINNIKIHVAKSYHILGLRRLMLA